MCRVVHHGDHIRQGKDGVLLCLVFGHTKGAKAKQTTSVFLLVSGSRKKILTAAGIFQPIPGTGTETRRNPHRAIFFYRLRPDAKTIRYLPSTLIDLSPFVVWTDPLVWTGPVHDVN